MTPKNIRFHAAGHISAAKVLLDTGNVNGTRSIMEVIKEYASHEKVECPAQVLEMIQSVVDEPVGKQELLMALEAMFVDDFNTKIEESGGLSG